MRPAAGMVAAWGLAVLAVTGPAMGQTILGVGGQTVQGRVVELDAGGRLVIEPARRGDPIRIPLVDVIEIQFDKSPGNAAAGAAVRQIFLRNGDTVQGDVAGIDGDSLTMTCGPVGRLTAPVDAVRGLLHERQGVADAVVKKARTEVTVTEDAANDVIYLANGDSASGAIRKLANGRLEMKHLGLNKQVVVDLHDVIGLRFARIGAEPAATPGVIARAELRDGSRLSGRITAIGTERVGLTWLGDQAINIPLRDVQRIRFIGGRMAWLSDLPPAERAETPLLGPAFTLAIDRTSHGRDLSIGGRTFRRGLATHSRSRYTWKLGKPAEAFESFVGIDDESSAGGEGSVVFRVLVDGQEQFNSGVVRGGQLAKYVRVDLTGAREVTLCVDEADELDLADQADWAEAHLIGASKEPSK